MNLATERTAYMLESAYIPCVACTHELYLVGESRQGVQSTGGSNPSSEWTSPEPPATPFHPPSDIWSLISLLVLLDVPKDADAPCEIRAFKFEHCMEELFGDPTGAAALAAETLQVRYLRDQA